jgi:hypothetical protein
MINHKFSDLKKADVFAAVLAHVTGSNDYSVTDVRQLFITSYVCPASEVAAMEEADAIKRANGIALPAPIIYNAVQISYKNAAGKNVLLFDLSHHKSAAALATQKRKFEKMLKALQVEAAHGEALEMDAALSAPVAGDHVIPAPQGERGERVYNVLKGEPLQDWLSIVIRRDADGRATVETRSRFHVNVSHTMRNTWGNDYSDAEILNDDHLLRTMYQLYGREIFTVITTREFN